MKISRADHRCIIVKSRQIRLLIAFLLPVLMNYSGWQQPIEAQVNQSSPTAAAPLRTYAQRLGFYVGAAVNITPFRNEAQYTETLKREFNMIVAENAFKFDAVHPSPNTYNFTETDALVNFAEANGMKIRGHVLVWHNQLPAWVTSGSFTRDQAIALMRDHIYTLAGRYRGRIAAWDVVNEAIDDGTNSLRTDSFWYRTIGADYIELAFRFAHEADPDAILYYNDYSSESAGAKSDAVYNLMVNLKNRGVPVQGVGWQSHFVNGFRITASHHTNAQRLAALGLEVSLTEVDLRTPVPSDANSLATQASGYRDLIDFCLSEPNVKALVMWGFTDKYSWIPGFFPGYGDALIFDKNYQPKPSYTALLNGLQAAPLKPILLQFDADSYTVAENAGSVNVKVTRTGNPDPVTVDFMTSDGTARQRTDYEARYGTLNFAAGETSKTFSVLINDNAYKDGNRTINLTLLNPSNASLDLRSTSVITIVDDDAAPSATNPVDDARIFVRQHYYDFLNRTPDQSGWDYWTTQITSCNGDAACIDDKRQNVSAAYFLSREFQETGFFVIRVQRAAFGKTSNDATKRISYLQFSRDTQLVGNGFVDLQAGADQILEQNKNLYVQTIAGSSNFRVRYPGSLSAAQYVDALYATAGITPQGSERQDAITAFGSGDAAGRAAALRKVAESNSLKQAEFAPAFVLMQYFGYLRRNPTDLPDTSDAGYQFWLNKLNSFGGDYIRSEMVRSFIVSQEYRKRFGGN